MTKEDQPMKGMNYSGDLDSRTELATPREGKKGRLSSKQTTARKKPRDLARH